MKEKISGIVKEHPLLDMAFEAYLIFLPPPLGTIAQNIYNNAKGSENDRVNAVLKYFDELKEEGQEHYEIVANKIDSTLVGIQDLKDIGNSIFKIQELLIEEIRDIDRKIDDIKRVLKADHSAIMQPRWEKEKNAFVIGEGLMSNLMSSYNQKEKRTLADHMFFDLVLTLGLLT